MTGYSELVKALRCGTNRADKNHNCEKCRYYSNGCLCTIAMDEAAAAIEALQAEVEKKRTADCWGCKCEKMEASSRLQKRGEPVLLAALSITNEYTEGSVRLVCLRDFLFSKIREAFEEEGAIGKSIEGAFEVVHCFPAYYEEEYKTPYYSGECWIIRLYCYVVGPSRHYEWKGITLLDAVKKAEKEIYGWFGQEPPKEDA